MAQQPFTIGILKQITDQYDAGEISYGKLVELLNDVALKWHNSTISKTETVKTMAQQRLYTEEQVKKMIDMAHNGYDGYYDIMSPFAPIYIPDNNDVEEISKHEILYNNAKRDWWLNGANYILNILKLQLDGQDD